MSENSPKEGEEQKQAAGGREYPVDQNQEQKPPDNHDGLSEGRSHTPENERMETEEHEEHPMEALPNHEELFRRNKAVRPLYASEEINPDIINDDEFYSVVPMNQRNSTFQIIVEKSEIYSSNESLSNRQSYNQNVSKDSLNNSPFKKVDKIVTTPPSRLSTNNNSNKEISSSQNRSLSSGSSNSSVISSKPVEINRFSIEDSKYSKKINRCRPVISLLLSKAPIIYLVLSLIIFLIIMGLMHSAKLPKKQDRLLFVSLKENLLLPLIQDIKIIDGLNSFCPQGYQRKTLGRWQGSRKGYMCDGYIIPDSNNKTKSQNTDFTKNCDIIKETKPRDLFMWEENLAFCLKYVSNFHFIDQDENSCLKPNYKKCLKRYCIPEGESCPLNIIQYRPNHHFPDFESSSIYTGPEYSIWVASMNSSYDEPFVDLRTVFDYPCYISFWDPLRHRGFDYPLVNQTNMGCKEFGFNTMNSVEINSIDESDYYKENGMDVDVLALPRIRDYIKDEKSKLFGIRRFQVNYNAFCQENKFYDFPLLNHDRDEDLDILRNLATVGLALVVVSMIVLWTLNIINRKNREEKPPLLNSKKYFLYMIVFLYSAIVFGFYVIGRNNNLYEASKFRSIINEQCFSDGIFKQYLKTIYDEFVFLYLSSLYAVTFLFCFGITLALAVCFGFASYVFCN